MLSIFLIGLALSMDAFSLSLGFGTTIIPKNKKLHIALLVGIMHFFMPLLGIYISDKLGTIFEINFSILIIIIFIYAGIIMIKDLNSKEKSLNYSYINMLILSFSVSVDSFSIGLVLQTYNLKFLLPSTIFFLCSFSITYIGLTIGEYSTKYLKTKAPILGATIFFILAIVNIIKYFT